MFFLSHYSKQSHLYINNSLQYVCFLLSLLFLRVGGGCAFPFVFEGGCGI